MRRSSAGSACAPLSRRAMPPSGLSRWVIAAALHHQGSWWVRRCCTQPLPRQRPRPVTKGASSDSPLEGKKHRRPPPSVKPAGQTLERRDGIHFATTPHLRPDSTLPHPTLRFECSVSKPTRLNARHYLRLVSKGPQLQGWSLEDVVKNESLA